MKACFLTWSAKKKKKSMLWASHKLTRKVLSVSVCVLLTWHKDPTMSVPPTPRLQGGVSNRHAVQHAPWKCSKIRSLPPDGCAWQSAADEALSPYQEIVGFFCFVFAFRACLHWERPSQIKKQNKHENITPELQTKLRHRAILKVCPAGWWGVLK